MSETNKGLKSLSESEESDSDEESGFSDAPVGSAVASCPPVVATPSAPARARTNESLTPGSKTFVEVFLLDEDDNPIKNQKYRIILPDGSKQEGKTDGAGRVFFPDIPPGTCDLMYSEIIDYGVPPQEVNRSWDWQKSNGTVPKTETVTFDENEVPTINAGERDSDTDSDESDSTWNEED